MRSAEPIREKACHGHSHSARRERGGGAGTNRGRAPLRRGSALPPTAGQREGGNRANKPRRGGGRVQGLGLRGSRLAFDRPIGVGRGGGGGEGEGGGPRTRCRETSGRERLRGYVVQTGAASAGGHPPGRRAWRPKANVALLRRRHSSATPGATCHAGLIFLL